MRLPVDSPWMTKAEAATYAKRGKRALARAVHAGDLRAARIGGRGELLFRREWLDEWIEAQARPVMVPIWRTS
jgi:excisionase family DNA binding protein